jgi:hypothetical protein
VVISYLPLQQCGLAKEKIKIVHCLLEGDHKLRVCMRICFSILESVLILFEMLVLIMENNEFKKYVFCTKVFLCLYTVL